MSFVSTVIKGLVQRALPSAPNADNANNDIAVRLDPYGGVFTQPAVRKSHVLADEGSYYTAGQSGAIVPTYGTSLVTTSPFITIYNANAALRVYVDYVALAAVVAGAQTTAVGYTALGVVVDSGNRYSSAGTQLTPNNVNLVSGNAAGVIIWCGAIVAGAASANARTLVPGRNLRPSVSTTVINVAGDAHLLNFGSVEGAAGTVAVANANIMPQALPPLLIPPLSTALLYLWWPLLTAPSAATYAPEVGFWVR